MSVIQRFFSYIGQNKEDEDTFPLVVDMPEQSVTERIRNYCSGLSISGMVTAGLLSAAFVSTAATAATLIAYHFISMKRPPPVVTAAKICSLLPLVGRPYLNATNTSLIQTLSQEITELNLAFCSGTNITDPTSIQEGLITQGFLQKAFANATAYALTGRYPKWDDLTPWNAFSFIYYVMSGDPAYSGAISEWYENYRGKFFAVDTLQYSSFTALEELCNQITSLAPQFTETNYSCISRANFATTLIPQIAAWKNVWPGKL